MTREPTHESRSADPSPVGEQSDSTPETSSRPATGVDASAGDRSERGQTTLDFAVGTTLFVFIFVSVFLFLPGTLQPFTQGAQEEISGINRVTDTLATDKLGNPNQPYVLNDSCTVAFFGGPSASGCRFDDGAPLNQQVGVKDWQSVNVTLRGNVTDEAGGDPNTEEILCWDDSANSLVESDDCSDPADTVFAEGDDVASASSSTVTARRIVSVDGKDVSLIVKLW